MLSRLRHMPSTAIKAARVAAMLVGLFCLAGTSLADDPKPPAVPPAVPPAKPEYKPPEASPEAPSTTPKPKAKRVFDPNRPESPPMRDPDDLIYGSTGAHDLIIQARAFDPRNVGGKQGDRDKAAGLYEKAIDKQPDQPISAVLADRIAQLYAHYADPNKEVRPKLDVAKKWWTRCTEMTDRSQLLWAQALMGLSNVAIIQQDSESAFRIFNVILAIDPKELQLEPWRKQPSDDTEEGKETRELRLERLRYNLAGLQETARKLKAMTEENLAKQEKLLK